MNKQVSGPLVVKVEVTKRFCSMTGAPEPVRSSLFIEDSNGRHVGILSDAYEAAASVIALVESSVDMLGALKAARKMIQNESLAEAQPAYLEMIGQLDAVIAKAERKDMAS